MEISVPSSAARTRSGPANAGQCSSPRDQQLEAAGPMEPASRRRLIAVSDLPSELPITDRERQLVAAYLGDVINQILAEPL